MAPAMLAGMAIALGEETAETTLRVNASPGVANLPVFVSERHGFFAQRGLRRKASAGWAQANIDAPLRYIQEHVAGFRWR